MQVIKVEPKDLYITFEISLEDAMDFIKGLEIAKAYWTIPTDNPEKAKQVSAVVRLNNMLDEVVEDLKKDGA